MLLSEVTVPTGFRVTSREVVSANPRLHCRLPSVALGPGIPGLHHAGAGSTGRRDQPVPLFPCHSGSDAGIQGQGGAQPIPS
jgi:hypothetical protein